MRAEPWRSFLYVLAANTTSVDVLALPAAGQATRIQNVNFADAAKKLGVKLSMLAGRKC